jgi:glycosyltransferase involved in cell wall biosynthesis
MPKLSIVIPVYNEKKFIKAALEKIIALEIDKEIIVVDDASCDGTENILAEMVKSLDFKIVRHLENRGKGAAILRGLEEAVGIWFLVFDADLEYRAEDALLLLREVKKYESGQVAIYGSRFLGGYKNKFSIHYFANKFLTFLANFLFGLKLTDMETCLKLCPTKILKKLNLQAQRFEFEPEITAKLAKRKIKIVEIPINYKRRNYEQGKKIKARDGLVAIKTLFKEFLAK